MALSSTPHTVIEIDDEGEVSTVFNGRITTVTISDYETGLRGRGHAKLHVGDVYDREIGEQLAYSRALRRYQERLEKFLIRTVRTEA